MANPALRAGQGRFARLFGRKDIVIPGENAGWKPFRIGGTTTAAADPRRLQTLMGTYGGTDDSVTWVFACIQLVQQELASYPYEILTERDEVIERNDMPPDLRELLDQPNEDMTYFDFVDFKAMDEELTGNSYWLKDDRNALGQPFFLRRLRPELIEIAVGDDGRIAGYLYTIEPTGQKIPFDRDEVIHFKRPNPLNEYYGMGTVEAIQRSLQADLAETDHVVGFFSNGARISGVLTTETLSETQFDRFREQFYEEYTGDANAHKILIAEMGTKFEPIQQPPAGTGVVELREMTKDEILSGFGIHEFLLGGAGQAGVYKMEEAQHIFGRKMVPKARRQSERITRDLTMLWSLKFRVKVTYAEPKSVKVNRAKDMLGAGATVNEARREMDLPDSEEEWADLPVIPQGVAPFGMMEPGGAPTNTPSILSAGITKQLTELLKAHLDASGYEKLDAHDAKRADPEQVARLLTHHAEVLSYGTTRFTKTFRAFFSDQRDRVVRRMGVKRKADLDIAALWDARIEDRELLDAWMAALDAIAERAMDTEEFELLWESDSPFAREMRDRLGIQIMGINEETRERVSDTIIEGLRRGYSILQIAHGHPVENYDGVAAIFDNESRVETIARTETAIAHNNAILIGFKAEGVTHVEVFDGTYDDVCREARGSVWTVERALIDPISHPRCVRTFAPVTSA